MRSWLDTDVGSDVDDALALAYALGIGGRADVPVVSGLGAALTPGGRWIVLGCEGRGLLEDPQPRHRVDVEVGGQRRIAELGDAVVTAGAARIVAIGPLTDQAPLARAERSITIDDRGATTMGAGSCVVAAVDVDPEAVCHHVVDTWPPSR